MRQGTQGYYRIHYIYYKNDKDSFEIPLSSEYLISFSNNNLSITKNNNNLNFRTGFFGYYSNPDVCNISDAIGIVGENGAGKTTLCRTILEWISEISIPSQDNHNHEWIVVYEDTMKSGELLIGKSNNIRKMPPPSKNPEDIKIYEKTVYDCCSEINKIAVSYYSSLLEASDYGFAKIYSNHRNYSVASLVEKSTQNKEDREGSVIREDQILTYFKKQNLDMFRFVIDSDRLRKLPFAFPEKIYWMVAQYNSFKDIINNYFEKTDTRVLGIFSGSPNNEELKKGMDDLFKEMKKLAKSTNPSSIWINLCLNICAAIYLELSISWTRPAMESYANELSEDQSNLWRYIGNVLEDLCSDKEIYQSDEIVDGSKLFYLLSEKLRNIAKNNLKDKYTKYRMEIFADYSYMISKSVQQLQTVNPHSLEIEVNKNKHNANKGVANLIEMVQHFETHHLFQEVDYGLSAGEFDYLSLYQKIDNEVSLSREEYKRSLLMILDEPDVTLHPEWQRCFFDGLIKFLNQYNDISIQLIITTHSPLILSDFTKDSVYCVRKDEGVRLEHMVLGTFGNNVHTLLAESFFLNNGTVGEFSKNVINYIADMVKNKKLNQDELMKLIDQLGNPLIGQRLMQLASSETKNEITIDHRKTGPILESLYQQKNELEKVIRLIEEYDQNKS